MRPSTKKTLYIALEDGNWKWQHSDLNLCIKRFQAFHSLDSWTCLQTQIMFKAEAVELINEDANESRAADNCVQNYCLALRLYTYAFSKETYLQNQPGLDDERGLHKQDTWGGGVWIHGLYVGRTCLCQHRNWTESTRHTHRCGKGPEVISYWIERHLKRHISHTVANDGMSHPAGLWIIICDQISNIS